MVKLTGFVAASVCSFVLTGSTLWATESLPCVTADWQDGFAPGYSGYGSDGGPSPNGPYEQWSPNQNSQYDPNFSPYGAPPNDEQFPNSRSPFAPGQGSRRQGRHHGRGYPGPFNNNIGGPLTTPNYGDSNWGATPYGPSNGVPFGPAAGQPYGQGSVPSQSQFFGQGRAFSPQAPSSPFGPSTNAPPPPFPNRGLQSQSYPGQNFSDPYSPLNQPLNSYNQQSNPFGPSQNQFGAPSQSFSQPGYSQPSNNQPSYNQPGYSQPNYIQPGYRQPNFNQPSYNQPNASYGQPGASFGQPRSNFGQYAPAFSQPQPSPFYP